MIPSPTTSSSAGTAASMAGACDTQGSTCCSGPGRAHGVVVDTTSTGKGPIVAHCLTPAPGQSAATATSTSAAAGDGHSPAADPQLTHLRRSRPPLELVF